MHACMCIPAYVRDYVTANDKVLDESDGWGLLPMDPADATVGKANRKHFLLAQYSRHLRPGMLLLRTDNHDTVGNPLV